MELKRIFRIAWRWWWLGLTPVVVVAAYLAATYQRPATSYQVILRFTTGSEPSPELSPDHDRYYAWLASEYIANGLADLATTSGFNQAVTQRLADRQITVAPQAIQGALVTDNAQSVLVVHLTWPDPQQAVAIAEAVGAELLESGSDYYPQMDNVGSVARLADIPIAIPLRPSLGAQLLGPAIRMAIAAATGIGLICLTHYLDPRVRETGDLRAAGLRVLGSIPRAGKQRP
jgi:capsular polysaccharide biosynthesis protein